MIEATRSCFYNYSANGGYYHVYPPRMLLPVGVRRLDTPCSVHVYIGTPRSLANATDSLKASSSTNQGTTAALHPPRRGIDLCGHGQTCDFQ